MNVDLDEASKHLLALPRRAAPAQQMCSIFTRIPICAKLSLPAPSYQATKPAVKEPDGAFQ
jgi:hypothetical protein